MTAVFDEHRRLVAPLAERFAEAGFRLYLVGGAVRDSLLAISGTLDLEIGDSAFTLHPGDSFRIRGEPFRWINPYDAPAVAIWVIAPPVY